MPLLISKKLRPLLRIGGNKGLKGLNQNCWAP
jgi:hypothetical protein